MQPFRGLDDLEIGIGNAMEEGMWKMLSIVFEPAAAYLTDFGLLYPISVDSSLFWKSVGACKWA